MEKIKKFRDFETGKVIEFYTKRYGDSLIREVKELLKRIDNNLEKENTETRSTKSIKKQIEIVNDLFIEKASNQKEGRK